MKIYVIAFVCSIFAIITAGLGCHLAVTAGWLGAQSVGLVFLFGGLYLAVFEVSTDVAARIIYSRR